MKFLGPLCLCKGSEYADITTVDMPFRLLFCLDCGKYRLEYRDHK